MKISIGLCILLSVSNIALSQSRMMDLSSFKTFPVSICDREKILFEIIKQKAYDYWEYRYAYEIQSNDCPPDSLGCIPSMIYKYDVWHAENYKHIDDSIQVSKINCGKGFWWLPPSGGVLYLVAIKSNKIDTIVNKDELFEFLKPFDSIDKIRLFFDDYIPLKYKISSNYIELIIYDKGTPIRDYKNKSGYFEVFKKYYFRIYHNGKHDKRIIGEYHLKSNGPRGIP